MGLNRFVIHTSVHQPVHDKMPGLGLGPFGQWFTRHETWAEQAKAWTTYLARSSYMLQQGRFVADIVYYYGEDSNVTALFGDKAPPIPAGYNFDYVNSDVVMNRLSVADGRLTHADGHELPRAGARSEQPAHAAGRAAQDPRPGDRRRGRRRPEAASTPSLSDDEAEFKTIADQLWGGRDRGRWPGPGRAPSPTAPGASLQGRAARLRVHEAAGRHGTALRAPQARRRRRVLG